MTMRVGSCKELRGELLKLRQSGDRVDVVESVRKIVEDVRRLGLQGLRTWSLQLDGFEPEAFYPEDFERAWNRLPFTLRRSLQAMADRIRGFHAAQLPNNVEVHLGGVRLRLLWKPVSSVGVYVPGGSHPYVSTMLMGAIPARVAGVERVVAACPFRDQYRDAILGAAHVAGVSELLRCGGAQAVAAMAFGVAVKRVDKVVGPGSVYVQLAKLEVSRYCGIDFYAGPTELAVISDGSADPKHVALDMLAQAEHGGSSLVVLLDVDEEHLKAVYEEYSREYREGFAETFFLHVDSLAEAVELVNELAPEHLLLAVRNPDEILDSIVNAGAISINTPPALMDYAAGSNHILPTGGWSRFKGALTVYEFLKPIVVADGLSEEADNISREVAEVEGMEYHRKSMEKL